MSRIIATFAVYAGTTVEFQLDVEGMTDQEIAAAVEEASGQYLDTSLCHECVHLVVDPQAEELSGLQVDDREIDLDRIALSTDEPSTAVELPAIDFPFDVLEAAARHIHTSYDRSTPVEQHEAREAARDALNAAAARLAVRRG